jgi:hypothetical protein
MFIFQQYPNGTYLFHCQQLLHHAKLSGDVKVIFTPAFATVLVLAT